MKEKNETIVPNIQAAKHQYIPTVEFYGLVIDILEDYSVFTLDVK
jgi:hypothetical protein